MKINNLAEFIKTHVTEINNNDFTKVYKDADISLEHPASITKLTEIFLDAGIEPLKYMKEVPDRYLDESKITSVEIPNNITSIGRSAFRDCDDLTSITISNSVTKIGISAFSGCTALKSVTIPDSVTSIGNSAFYDCYSLDTINFEGTKEQWNAIAKGDSWNGNVPATQVICTDGTVNI